VTSRRDTMPRLCGASAHWDAEGSKVRYFAIFDGDDECVEVTGEEFSRLTQHYAQDAIDFAVDSIATTLERVNAAMEEFMTFRKAMEGMMPRQSPPEGN
jgi:hypothetical protein